MTKKFTDRLCLAYFGRDRILNIFIKLVYSCKESKIVP